MKKTFKVKNILKNKNKYNFKTELLLSALSLLVAFGTVSCKKDPVKPKNNTENPVNPKDTIDTKSLEEKLINQLRNSTKRLDELPVHKSKSGQLFGPKINFFNSVFAGKDMKNINNLIDSLSGGTSLEQAEENGYIPVANIYISNKNNKADSILIGIKNSNLDYVN